MLATVGSATLIGVEGRAVSVEVHVSMGMPQFTVVGLPDASCREARDRVRAAILSSGLSWPQRRVTVNLAPSDVRKGGTALDLPIAVALLAADGQLDPALLTDVAFLGELGLDGSLRRVAGVVALVDALVAGAVVVPVGAAAEARLLGRHRVLPALTLRGLIAALRNEEDWAEPPAAAAPARIGGGPGPDLCDVRGQPVGGWRWRSPPPAATPASRRSTRCRQDDAGAAPGGLLPRLGREAAIEVTRDPLLRRPAAAGGGTGRPATHARPHHSASLVSLVGGGRRGCARARSAAPTTASSSSTSWGSIRPPCSTPCANPRGWTRAGVPGARSARFPARFLLVAAMIPCPCGGDGAPGGCRCTEVARARYASRVSGPLLDRFDLRVGVDRPEVSELLPDGPSAAGESSAQVAERVLAARRRARARGVPCNSELPGERLDDVAPLDPPARRLLETWMRQGRLSARGLHRVRRVARTIADLGGRDGPVGAPDVQLALALRTEPFAPVPVAS